MAIALNDIKVIGFDADDTLWVNETYFREAESEFARLLSAYETENKIEQELYKKEIENLGIYGYGIKGFVLSMVECALELSNNTIKPQGLAKILDIGKAMLNKPVEVLEGVQTTLKSLQSKYKIVLITKGDLLDQERKLEKSGLSDYFHHIEVLSDKKTSDYKRLLHRLEIDPKEFLMVGNSLKSDVLPLIQIGANAIHIPFHTTWIHERVEKKDVNSNQYLTVRNLGEIINLLDPERNGRPEKVNFSGIE